MGRRRLRHYETLRWAPARRQPEVRGHINRGLFVLFGVIKKNGIRQTDYTNSLREANHVRLRPILLPTVVAAGSGSSTRTAADLVPGLVSG